MTRYRARLIANEALNADPRFRNDPQPSSSDIRRLQLQVEGAWPSFHSGQYLGLLSPDGTPVFFSIASLPSDLPLIELHYAATPGSPDVARMDAILAATVIEFTPPAGTTGLFAVPDAESVLLAAAATGITQALAIVRDWARNQTHTGTQRPREQLTLRLYWGVRTADQLYCATLLDELAAAHSNFSWHAIVSEQPSWRGRQGLLVDALLADAHWQNADVFFISGGPAMVQATAGRLRDAGIAAERLRSDLL